MDTTIATVVAIVEEAFRNFGGGAGEIVHFLILGVLEFDGETDGISAVIRLGLAAQDGSTATVGVGIVTDTTIPFLFQKDGKSFNVIFEKE